MAAPTDPVSDNAIEPTRAVIECAAAWHVQLTDTDCTDDDRARFEVWLSANPAHRIAFDRMDTLEKRASGQDAIGRSALHAMFSRRSKRAVPLVLLLGGMVAVGWMAAHNPQIRSQMADVRTEVGELKPTTLATGDTILLDSDSAADVDIQDRTINLWRGGVMASVHPGLFRSFIVRTGQGTARALGTKFSVQITRDSTTVNVIESHVEACATQGRPHCVTLSPGQSARLDATGAHRQADIDPMVADAWSNGLLIADDRPLAGIIDELNRYRTKPIRYRSEDIAGLHLSGTFPLTDTDRALASIAAALPVRLEEDGDGIAVRRRK